MSSTSSERNHSRSDAESLSSRYRHLFVLPSSPQLLLYGAVSSLVLAILSQGTAGAVSFFLPFIAFVLSGAALSASLKLLDKRTIANYRRALATLLGAEILWLILTAVARVYGWASGSTDAYTNGLLFGAFVCMGFEFLIINGAFEKNAPLSLVLSFIHPASTLTVLRLSGLSGSFDLPAAVCGVIALGR